MTANYKFHRQLLLLLSVMIGSYHGIECFITTTKPIALRQKQGPKPNHLLPRRLSIQQQQQHDHRLLTFSRHTITTTSKFVVVASDSVNNNENSKQQQDQQVSSISNVPNAVFGLIKAMVGSGLLALASGLAACTDHANRHTLISADLLLIAMGMLSAYTFSIYGRLIHITQAKTLGALWKSIYTNPTTTTSTPTTALTASDSDSTNTKASASVSVSSDLTVSLVTFIFCFGCCIAYSLTFGDMCSSFLRGIVSTSTTTTAAAAAGTATSLLSSSWLLSRQASILLLTTTVVFPLCRLSSLSALAPTSIIGVIGTLVTIAFLAFRCPAIVTGSPYSTTNNGMMLSNLLQQPSFSTYSYIRSPAPLILIAMACVSYMAHFSAPDFYHSFVEEKPQPIPPTTGSTTTTTTRPLRQYNQMTIIGYSIVVLLNICALTCSFLTFGGVSDGIILNNYSHVDIGAIISRLLVGISVIGSYPFVMRSCRNAAIELWNAIAVSRQQRTASTSQLSSPLPPQRQQHDERNQLQIERRMTTILLCIVTGISLITKNAGFVIGFNGAVMGSTIAFTIPALLFLKYHSNQHGAASNTTGSVSKREIWACRSLIGFGIVSSIVGGITTVISSFFPQLLR